MLLSLAGETEKLFGARYKDLYFNYYNTLNKDNTQNYSYRWKGSYAKFFNFISLLSNFYINIINLFLQANLWELDVKTFIIKKSFKKEFLNVVEEGKNDYNAMLFEALTLSEKKRSFLIEKSELLKEKVKLMLEPFIKRKIRYKRWNITKTGYGTKQKVLRRSPLYYFLIYRRLKKARRLSIPRLKSVHWYIPSYIHFDFRTMQAVFLHNPLPEEIFYTFKCSLSQITSFYRSRGY